VTVGADLLEGLHDAPRRLRRLRVQKVRGAGRERKTGAERQANEDSRHMEEG
jgi:hypothetical protein